jgi:hypothetical protein
LSRCDMKLLLLLVVAGVAFAQQPVGTNKCTYGPAYWCANENNANECGALTTCQSMGLLQNVDPLLGSNHCSWGPVYACANMENANKCNMLQACQKMGLLKSNGDRSRRSDEPLLGSSNCTQGPAYWCATRAQANECKALKHCQAMGLLVDDNAPLLGSKCTDGPAYWCASLDNANECKTLSVCQAMGKLVAPDLGDNELLGSAACTQSPSYYCATAHNAFQCKSFDICVKLGLLTDDGKSTGKPIDAKMSEAATLLMQAKRLGSSSGLASQMPGPVLINQDGKPSSPADTVDSEDTTEEEQDPAPVAQMPGPVLIGGDAPQAPRLGANKCVSGPAYWCASVDNANECKMLEHCQSMGLLGGQRKQTPLGANKCVSGPAYWCASVDNANECKMLEHCQAMGMLRAVAGPVDGVECDVCKEVLKILDQYLSMNSTGNEIEKGLLDLCHDLPSDDQSDCTFFIQTFGPEIIQFLITDLLNPDTVCDEIGLCTGKPLTKKQMMDMMARAVNNMRKHRPITASECDICKDVIGALQSALTSNSTQEEILQDVEKLCDAVGPLKKVCTSFVEEYGPEVLNYLASEIDPQTLCADIGVCPKQRFLNGVPFPPKN